MKIYRAVKSDYLSQGFGANQPCSMIGVRPFVVVNRVNGVCPPGSEPFYQAIGLKGHNGYDRSTWHGEPLYFNVDLPEAGGWKAVNASDLDGGLGIDVISKKEIVLDGVKAHVKFRYWHLQKGLESDDVKLGQLIGFCDNTGASSGDHCHDSMKRCDSYGNALNKNNGYQGAIPYDQYFENTFILDEIKRRNAISDVQIKIEEAQLTLVDTLRKYISILKNEIAKLSTPGSIVKG